MAMAGEWQVTSERIVEAEGEKKPEAVALGVRKRVTGEEDEEEIEAKKQRWGSKYRTYPTEEDDDGDLDALLNNATRNSNGLTAKTEAKDDVKRDVKKEIEEEIKTGPEVDAPTDLPSDVVALEPRIKREPSDGEAALASTIVPLHADLKQEVEEPNVTDVVFKKRKAKNIRQK